MLTALVVGGDHLVAGLQGRVGGALLEGAAGRGRRRAGGLGGQSRSFMYGDDCLEWIRRLLRPNHAKPLNLCTDRMVTVDELADITSEAVQKDVEKTHDTSS